MTNNLYQNQKPIIPTYVDEYTCHCLSLKYTSRNFEYTLLAWKNPAMGFSSACQVRECGLKRKNIGFSQTSCSEDCPDIVVGGLLVKEGKLAPFRPSQFRAVLEQRFLVRGWILALLKRFSTWEKKRISSDQRRLFPYMQSERSVLPSPSIPNLYFYSTYLRKT